MIPKQLSHYRLLEKIGAGGMGVVHRAHDDQLDRDVALKVLPAHALHDDRTRQRFRKEALALARLNHPNIGAIYEFGTENETDFLVMELVSGVALDVKLGAGPMAEREVLRLGVQLADGLDAAHSQGIVHRDLKPGNIRLSQDNRIKILDFGIAQFIPAEGASAETVTLTMPHEIMGTVAYMAPEQIRGHKADARTDIYSTGVVLYEMATGKRPFPDTSGPQLISAILEQPPSSPSSRNHEISPALESIIVKAIDKDPDRRYQSARELRIDLERLSTGVVPVAVRPTSGWKWIAGIGFALLLVAAGALYNARFHELPRSQAPVTEVAPGITPRRAVAVLGFRNLSGKADNAWLSTALAEMLTTELAAGEQLRTIPGENVARMKKDLSLPEADSFSGETLARIRRHLGSDLVVLGTFLESGNQIRLDFRLQDAVAGETLASFSENGQQSELLDLVSRTGANLRQRLAINQITAEQSSGVRASLPTTPEAARLYVQGLEKLRVFEALAARDLLQQAVAADANHALAHSALSDAWSALGYDAKAREEAKRAFDLSANLSRESRLAVEARYRSVTRDWGKAIENYRALWNFFPDNLEYGLRLADVQVSAGQGKDALLTVEQMRRLPPPAVDDARIDIAEAHAAESLGDFQRAQQAAGRAAEKGRAKQAQLVVAEALAVQGWAYERLGQMDKAASLVNEAEGLYFAAGDRRAAANMAALRGSILYDRGDFAGDLQAVQEALKVFREIGAQGSVARNLNNIGNVLYETGKLEQAQDYYTQSLKIYREIDDKRGAAGCLGNLANVYDSMGNLTLALQIQNEGLQAFRDVGDRRGEASTLNNLGNVLAELGDLEGARKSYEQSLVVQEQIGYKRSRAFSLLGLADLLREQDKLDEARKSAGEALTLRQAMSDENNVAVSKLQIAQIAMEQRKFSEAETFAREAAATFEKLKLPQNAAVTNALLAQILLETGKTGDATAAAQKGMSFAQQVSDRGPKFVTAVIEAKTKAANGNPGEATKALQAVLNETSRNRYLPFEFEIRLALGTIEMKTGHAAEGRSRLEALERDARAKGFVRIARKARGTRT
jgi:eukaryotic-like serine/threonine-protein kinase